MSLKINKITSALLIAFSCLAIFIVIPTISYSSNKNGMTEIKLSAFELNFDTSNYVADEVHYVDGSKKSQSQLQQELIVHYQAEWEGSERDHDIQVFSGDSCNASVCITISEESNGIRHQTRIDYHREMKSGSKVSSSTKNYSGDASYVASNSDTTTQRNTLSKLTSSLQSLNSANSQLASRIRDKNQTLDNENSSHSSAKSALSTEENKRRSALTTLNNSISNLNSAATEKNTANQQASNARTEANRQADAVSTQINRKKALEKNLSEIKNNVDDLINQASNQSQDLNSKFDQLTNKVTETAGSIANVLYEHNRISDVIINNLGIDEAVEDLNINYDELIKSPNDFVLPVLPNGQPIKTPTNNPNYSKLVDAINLHESMKDHVAALNSEQVQYAYNLSEVGIILADEAYSEGDDQEGDEYLENSLVILDSVLDFVPGISFIKDVTSIVTGVNPITGEEVSDTERAIMMGTLFAPAAISGTAKVTTKLAKALKTLSDRAGPFSSKADELVESISKSDAELSKFTDLPCNSVVNINDTKGLLDWSRAIVFSVVTGVTSTAHASEPCEIGSVVDNVLANNTIVKEKHHAGSKGNWSDDLNNPINNGIYSINKNAYQTDSLGRTMLIDVPKMKYDPAARNNYQQKVAGRDDRLSDDVGGHLLGAQFGGAGEKINIVAMNKILNSSAIDGGVFGRLEMKWKQHILDGDDVGIQIKPVYVGDSLRPKRFDIIETINGNVIANRIINQAGG